MAKVDYAAPVDAIRGRLGELIFQGYRSTKTVRRFGAPVGPPSSLQQLRRDWLAFCSTWYRQFISWAGYDPFWVITHGSPGHGPRNWFMQVNLPRLNVDDPNDGDLLVCPSVQSFAPSFQVPTVGALGNRQVRFSAAARSGSPSGYDSPQDWILLYRHDTPDGSYDGEFAGLRHQTGGGGLQDTITCPVAGSYDYTAMTQWSQTDRAGKEWYEVVVFSWIYTGSVIVT